jgi:trigger factor
VTQTESSTTQREIQVEIPTEVVARETDAVVQKLQKFARLPGFRSGKVPPSVIRQRFPEEIRTEVLEALVPRYFREEAQRQGLTPVSQPRVTDLHLDAGAPLRFKASFEVLPPIELGGYDQLPVEKKDASASDQEVEEAIQHLREQNATYRALEDRPLQDGDFAQVSLRGLPTGEGDEAGKPVEVEDVLVEIGGAGTVPEFSENLRGASPGETRTFEVQYGEDVNDRRLAGKRFSYTAEVKGVKSKELPELNEEFARELGVGSVEEVRTQLRENIQRRKQIEAEREGKEKILEMLLERHPFEVPEAMVERMIDVRLERGLRALAAQGMRPEDMKRMDFPRLRAGQREAAMRDVRVSILLERIAGKEGVEVSEEEVEKEVQEIAQQARQPVDEVRSRLAGEGAMERLRSRLRNDKTLDLLYQRSA